jgi:hypothetical protein
MKYPNKVITSIRNIQGTRRLVPSDPTWIIEKRREGGTGHTTAGDQGARPPHLPHHRRNIVALFVDEPDGVIPGISNVDVAG